MASVVVTPPPEVSDEPSILMVAEMLWPADWHWRSPLPLAPGTMPPTRIEKLPEQSMTTAAAAGVPMPIDPSESIPAAAGQRVRAIREVSRRVLPKAAPSPIEQASARRRRQATTATELALPCTSGIPLRRAGPPLGT
ncbi:hypothetical protein [Streptomyces eurocidicus]|uniref:Uncharacterized protein n=1 Tax=Streptomyces eurocidicus TaxID=66423 RepID=A0A7W8BEG4_STREU|nr:hypothetical protein [Streptomyces eurocidicus]MBB5121845.1 hypothetical protein [Streptomyces eurocidicus]